MKDNTSILGESTSRFVSILGIIGLLTTTLFPSSGWSQCTISQADCKTYGDVTSENSGNTITVGNDIPSNADFTFTSGQMLLIPTGENFTGTVNGANINEAKICLANAGLFNPTALTNFTGLIYNFNDKDTLYLNNYTGSIHNTDGLIKVTNTPTISNKYILNCDGSITWVGPFDVGNGEIYNQGTMIIQGNMSGQGCVYNDGWITMESYNGNNTLNNYGKMEFFTVASFESGDVTNHCIMFSDSTNAEFINHTGFNNFGMIFFPKGSFFNDNSMESGEKGALNFSNFENNGSIIPTVLDGGGWFWVSEESKNNGPFGNNTTVMHFYDNTPTPPNMTFDSIKSLSVIGTAVSFTPFPEPFYSLGDDREFECGPTILGGRINPGEIAESQVICLGQSVQPFISVTDGYSQKPGATIAYQWQKSTDSLFYYSILGATGKTYTVPSRPAVKTYYRRKISSTFNLPFKVLNSVNFSNVISITPIDEPAAVFTANPINTDKCLEQNAIFTATAENYYSLQWQESTDYGNTWNDLIENATYVGVTTSTLTVFGVTSLLNGNEYRLMAINLSCGNVYSDAAVLTVIPDWVPNITSQPVDQYVCPDDISAQFTVLADDVDIYQWQDSVDNINSWTNLSNNTDFSGVLTNTLTVTNNGLDELQHFRCLIISTACDDTVSVMATLYPVIPEVTVTPSTTAKCPDLSPDLYFNPLDDSYDMGYSSVTFTIQRISDGPYAWSFDYTFTADHPEYIVNGSEQPQPISGSCSLDTDSTTVTFTFLLENQTTESINTTLTISNVVVAGCTEATNPNHSAAIRVRRMPVSGIFNNE